MSEELICAAQYTQGSGSKGTRIHGVHRTPDESRGVGRKGCGCYTRDMGDVEHEGGCGECLDPVGVGHGGVGEHGASNVIEHP